MNIIVDNVVSWKLEEIYDVTDKRVFKLGTFLKQKVLPTKKDCPLIFFRLLLDVNEMKILMLRSVDLYSGIQLMVRQFIHL